MNKTSKIILVVVILVIVGGGAFYSGTLYGKNQASVGASALRTSFATTRGAARNGTGGGGFISGAILSKDINNGITSITVKLPSATGGSKIVYYSDTTQIEQFTSGTADTLTPGASVNITGTTNPDGTVIANSIQIRPAGQNK